MWLEKLFLAVLPQVSYESVGTERTDRLGNRGTIRKDKNDTATAKGIAMVLAKCQICSQSH